MREKNYNEFENLLRTGGAESYEALCRKIKVHPDDLDEVLLRELGYTGEQVFDEYFGNRCKNY